MSKPSKGETVKVVIRCRPMDSRETTAGHTRCIDMDTKKGIIEMRNPKADSNDVPRRFTFDAVYDWNSRQRDLYEDVFRGLIQSVLEGFNGTIFAYGQTGTGKTFTMQGVKEDPELRGVIPNSFEHIFGHIAGSANAQYLVRASYLEIYKEDIRDLLHKDQCKNLEIKEKPDTGVYVKDLSSVLTKSIKEIEKVMNIGNQNRSVGATNMNEHSSRSHAIFIVTIECSEAGMDGENHIRVGKLNMVDLAGSERQSKTLAEGERLKEATKINLSLSALGNVISALVDGKSTHVPYRDSKLTRLLQDSLGGNAKTVMVANVGPASYNFEETLNTLRYANRAKNIKNKPKINEDPKDALLREYQNEIERLKSLLTKQGGPRREPREKRSKRRKRRTIRPDGTEVEESESGSEGEEEEEEGNEASAEAYAREQQSRLEAEKQAILGNQNLIADEKSKLLKELQDKELRLKEERQQKEQLEAKIHAMESKLLRGDKDIAEHTKEQQEALARRRQQIDEQKRREKEIEQQMEEKLLTMTKVQEGFSSLKQEVEVTTKRLKKLFEKVQEVNQEIKELREEHIRERQEKEKNQEDLTREVKLKLLIIENFIPVEERTKLEARTQYDEDEDTWRLLPLANGVGDTSVMAKRPTSAIGGRRPVSEFARMAATMGPNPRYKCEQLLCLELDLPNRTTRDYEPPAMAPKVIAALDSVLKDDGDMEIDGSPSVVNPITAKIKKKEHRPRTAKRNEAEEFPISRGLVPK